MSRTIQTDDLSVIFLAVVSSNKKGIKINSTRCLSTTSQFDPIRK